MTKPTLAPLKRDERTRFVGSAVTVQRVAILTTNYYPRPCGVGDHSMRLGQALLRMGADVRVFSSGPAERHPDAPELHVHGVTGAFPLTRLLALVHAIQTWGANAVIVQYVPRMLGASRFGSPWGPLLAHWMRARDIRVIGIAHELYLPWAWRPDLALGAALNRLALLWLFLAVDRLAVTTEPRRLQALELAGRFGVEGHLSVLPIGSSALPVASRSVHGRFNVGVFSTLAHGKRMDVVLKAFERLVGVLPHARLMLIGDFGEPGNRRRRALSEKIRDSPAAAHIQLTGRLLLPDVAEAVADLDAYLFPMDVGATTRSSTLPLPLGAGVPVIALRGRDTGPLFVADENIVFADELTGVAFADAVLRLIKEPGLAETVSAGGRRLYRDHLDWAVLAGRTLDLLLGSSRSTQP